MTSAAEATGDPAQGRFSLEGVSVRGIVSAVPPNIVPNASFEPAFGEQEVREAARMIGVDTRRWVAAGQTTADLCQAAATVLLTRLDWAPDSVDALIFVSQTPDHVLPATACILQHRLGLSKRTAAFDVGLGCSGYVYGLWLASVLVNAGCSRVLLLAGDTSSRFLDKADSATALLFGDAGTATALEADPAGPPCVYRLGSDGEGAKNLMVARGRRSQARGEDDASDRLAMDGFQVFSFTLKSVPPLIRDTVAGADRALGEIDLFVLHQANAFMLRHIAKKLGLTAEKLPINIDRFGNTSSASIPLLITTDLSGVVTSRRTRVVLAGFGAGYSWGACVMDLERLACAETIVA